MTDVFLEEYNSDQALKLYRAASAGYGINYLLDHDYADVYRGVLNQHVPRPANGNGLRLLEFGCGAGMNLMNLTAIVEKAGYRLEHAYGTDFSDRLLEAARTDAARVLSPGTIKKLEFVNARNETLVEDLAAGLKRTSGELLGTFHLIFGVNTFRYSFRSDKENESARELFRLLAKGGVCVMIDMNAQFPMFRSQMRAARPAQPVQDKEFYIPVLEEYVRPFASAGFEIVSARNFCWIPHSAGRPLATACRILAPALNLLAPRYALRSLVIAKKPA